ncbi:hypothetical protein J6590_068327 [Homalodisca vitripennis]|nr:hypothetical protein J6590_068327 [Homalodisca vitripennis]
MSGWQAEGIISSPFHRTKPLIRQPASGCGRKLKSHPSLEIDSPQRRKTPAIYPLWTLAVTLQCCQPPAKRQMCQMKSKSAVSIFSSTYSLLPTPTPKSGKTLVSNRAITSGPTINLVPELSICNWLVPTRVGRVLGYLEPTDPVRSNCPDGGLSKGVIGTTPRTYFREMVIPACNSIECDERVIALTDRQMDGLCFFPFDSKMNRVPLWTKKNICSSFKVSSTFLYQSCRTNGQTDVSRSFLATLSHRWLDGEAGRGLLEFKKSTPSDFSLSGRCPVSNKNPPLGITYQICLNSGCTDIREQVTWYIRGLRVITAEMVNQRLTKSDSVGSKGVPDHLELVPRDSSSSIRSVPTVLVYLFKFLADFVQNVRNHFGTSRNPSDGTWNPEEVNRSRSSGTSLVGRHSTVHNCTFDSPQLYVRQSTTVLSTVHNCTFDSPQLYVRQSTTVRSTVHNCTFDSPQLYVRQSTTVRSTVHNCTFDCPQLYVRLSTTVRSTVHNCTFDCRARMYALCRRCSGDARVIVTHEAHENITYVTNRLVLTAYEERPLLRLSA